MFVLRQSVFIVTTALCARSNKTIFPLASPQQPKSLAKKKVTIFQVFLLYWDVFSQNLKGGLRVWSYYDKWNPISGPNSVERRWVWGHSELPCAPFKPPSDIFTCSIWSGCLPSEKSEHKSILPQVTLVTCKVYVSKVYVWLNDEISLNWLFRGISCCWST